MSEDLNLEILQQEIPKYLPQNISFDVKEFIGKHNLSLDEISSKYDVSKTVIQDILSFPHYFSLDMYKAASKLLNISFEELTASISFKPNLSFRKKNTTDDTSFDGDVNFAMNIFKEIIINRKLTRRT